MCGIAGIYSNNSNINRSSLETMSNVLAHRGPDGKGIWIHPKGNIGFIHRRLSIIDLSDEAKQPMQYLNRYTITYNGEIYNYIELKADLIREGYTFQTHSDTEVLLALYDKYEYECLSKLDGMFAFAIWDELKQELFIARDRFGEKPLFYTNINGEFCFASEMKALFAIGASRQICSNRVYRYLEYNELEDAKDHETTFYKNIKQLDAANYAIIKNASIIVKQRYWFIDLQKENLNISILEAIEEFKYLFTNSIKLRLRSDVPVGSSLSGGIDSTAIVLIINSLKSKGQTQKTFSARFKNFDKDEGDFIDMAVKYGRGIKSFHVWPNVEDLEMEIENLSYHQDEPFGSGSIYNQYCVMRLAKQNNTTVLLDGQGADEQLGGYLHYYHHYLTGLITQNFPLFLKEKKAFNKIHKGCESYRIPRRLPLWYLNKIINNQPYKYDRSIKSVLLDDTTNTHLKTLLRYADRNSMAFSTEVRLPFLSHDLVEFIFSLPVDFILREGWTKYILRKSLEMQIPKQIAWRKDKIGFDSPQEAWIKKMYPFISDFKNKNDYKNFTDGKVVNNITAWKWLMLKLYT